MSLGDGFHFAYICILPPQIKPAVYANAETRVMVEVFIVITSGRGTLQRLRGTGVTATSGCLGAGREGRVEAKGVGMEKKGKSHVFTFFILRKYLATATASTDNKVIIQHHTVQAASITSFIPSALEAIGLKPH